MKTHARKPEFWFLVLAALISGLIAADVFPPGSPWARVLAGLSVAMNLLGYSVAGGRASSPKAPMLLAFLAAVLAIGGCKASPAYYRSAKAGHDAILPEYDAYVTGDARLSPADKQLRLKTSATLRALDATEGARQ